MSLSDEGSLSSPRFIRELLINEGIRPHKSRGQNFLIDFNILQKIIRTVNLNSNDSVLEIGAGLGTLTLELAKHARHVTAVEIDKKLHSVLLRHTAEANNITIVHEDILKCRLELLPEIYSADSFRVVANIPYSISTPIIEKLIAHKHKITDIVLLVQDEFARRLTAKSGAEDFGSLSLYVQYHFKPEYLFLVPRHAFYPSPEVDSRLIRLASIESFLSPEKEAMMFKIIRAAFQSRRKTLMNGIKCLLPDSAMKTALDTALMKVGISSGVRAETLSLCDFSKITDAFIATINH